MDQQDEKQNAHPGIRLILALLITTIIYRLAASHFDFLGNTAPVMAIAFGGGLLLGLRFWWVPALLLIVSDLFLGLSREGYGIGTYTLTSMSVYIAISFLGGLVGKTYKALPMMWCGTMIASIVFYAIANTFAWAAFPGYAKTLAGWWQSQTTGLPQFSPQSWVFLRNALLADTTWCVIAGILFFRKGAFAESRAAAPAISE